MFNEAKTAQATAYLLYRAGGTMEHIKAMKLLYLADRLSWEKYNFSITGDDYYSLPYGPVLSNTLNLMRGEDLAIYQNKSVWAEWIADKEDHKISIKKAIDFTDEYALDELSESDVEILDEIFNKYGSFKPFALVEYTHNPKYIPEWKNPNGKSIPITLNELLTALGKTASEIEEIKENLAEQKEFDRLFTGGY